MLSSLTGMFTRLKENKIVQNIADNYNKLKQQTQKDMQIIEISSNLFHIFYPQPQTLPTLKKHIGNNDFQIWNISQYKYQPFLQKSILEHGEDGEIHHLCFQYYSNLPLYELIIAINSIHYFLQLSPNHRVYLHCQDNKIRSSVFLVCFLYKFGVMNIMDIGQAIFYINKKLNVNVQVEQKESQTVSYNNLHMFFKNFINYLNNPQIINKHKLELIKITISQAPKLKLPNQVVGRGATLKELKIVVQIRCKEEVILKANYDSTAFEGESICLELSKKTIILGDDFLVIVKYVYLGKIYSMMRIQLNTNFVIDKFFRAHQHFIDLSSYCLIEQGSMFIDFNFEENVELSDLAELQAAPQKQPLKLPKKHQAIELQRLSKLQTKQAIVQISPQSFSLHDQEEQQHEVDEEQINRKIQQVLKTINSKAQSQQREKEQDLDDYLSKLESQV